MPPYGHVAGPQRQYSPVVHDHPYGRPVPHTGGYNPHTPSPSHYHDGHHDGYHSPHQPYEPPQPQLPSHVLLKPAQKPTGDIAKGLICFCCCLTLIGVIVVAVVGLHMVGKPEYDCNADFANAAVGWSILKKEYCCKYTGKACHLVPGFDEHRPQPFDDTPAWLKWWLWDISMGIKFLISGTLAMCCGCCCGLCCYRRLLKRQIAEHRVQTEHELMHVLEKTLKRMGAKSGEITVTLMWDTVDDLDLHVKLPGQSGEISAENPRVAGGELDIDGNHCLGMSTQPIENIYWPTYDSHMNQHPPIGDYIVWVKLFDSQHHHSHPCRKEANITVVVSVCGHKDIYHMRMLPGCTQLRVCSFHYSGPAALQHRNDSPSNQSQGGLMMTPHH